MHSAISVPFWSAVEVSEFTHYKKASPPRHFLVPNFNTKRSKLFFGLVQRSPRNSNSSTHSSMVFRSFLLVVIGSAPLSLFRWIGSKTMGDSQSESSIFSVRIVSIDYYLAPPIPGLGVSYSSFQGKLHFPFVTGSIRLQLPLSAL